VKPPPRASRRRLLAIGGVIGPVAVVSTWATLGAVVAGYSPTQDAISRLAAVGADTRPVMTAGFVVFGVGVPLYGLALREALPGHAGTAAIVTGLATLGVAAFPLGTPTQDAIHGVWATIGYVSLAAVPLLAAGPLARQGRRGWARWSRVVGIVSAACLAATLLDRSNGAFQRLGLAVVDVSIVCRAIDLLRNRPVAGPEAP